MRALAAKWFDQLPFTSEVSTHLYQKESSEPCEKNFQKFVDAAYFTKFLCFVFCFLSQRRKPGPRVSNSALGKWLREWLSSLILQICRTIS